MATDLISRTGKAAALSAANHDQNLESLSGTVDTKTADYTVLFTDQNKTMEFNKSTAVTANLDAIATIIAAIDTTKFRVKIKNIGVGTLTIDPNGSETIDGQATYTVEQYEFVEIQIDGAGTGWNLLASLYTAARIKTLYESNADTNEFSDAEQTKLSRFTSISGNVTATQAELNIMDGITASTAELNLLAGKSLSSSDNVIDNFPAGTLMTFQQTSAPTGWTKQTTHNNKAFRVVSGTASSGGTVGFSTVFGRTATDSTTLTTNQIPAHKHLLDNNYLSKNWTGQAQTTTGTAFPNIQARTGTNYTSTDGGGGLGHTHPMDIRIQYVDLIIAAKN